MRTLIAWTLTLAVGASAVGTASGQATAPPPKRRPAGRRPPAARPPPAPLDPEAVKAQARRPTKARQEMNELLAEWEKQSKKITSLDVGFDRIDKLGRPGATQYYQGRAMLKSPDLACLEFQKYKVDADGKPLKPRTASRRSSSPSRPSGSSAPARRSSSTSGTTRRSSSSRSTRRSARRPSSKGRSRSSST